MPVFRHHALAGAICLTTLSSLAGAQTIPAACQPLVDAERKLINTPHHIYETEASSRPGANPAPHESISVGGAEYVLMGGKWIRSPMTTKDLREQQEENIRTTKWLECQRGGTETVAGASATVFTMRTDNDGVKASARIWVANGSGRIVKQEEDLDTGGPTETRHMSIRIEYDNVRAPAGVK